MIAQLSGGLVIVRSKPRLHDWEESRACASRSACNFYKDWNPWCRCLDSLATFLYFFNYPSTSAYLCAGWCACTSNLRLCVAGSSTGDSWKVKQRIGNWHSSLSCGEANVPRNLHGSPAMPVATRIGNRVNAGISLTGTNQGPDFWAKSYYWTSVKGFSCK